MFKLMIVLNVLLSAPAFCSGKIEKKLIPSSRISLEAKTQKEIVSVLESNEKLHSSFFEYDEAQVEANANEMIKKIQGITDNKISKLLAYSKKNLGDIKSSKTKKENNQSYHQVSMALIYIVNKYNVGNKYNAYSCPMVKKKWLQNSQKMAKVHNPYAPEMPHCGSQDSNH